LRSEISMFKNRRGTSLILAIMILAASGLMAALLLKMVYNNWIVASLNLQKEQAFYLSEAGLEMGKKQLAKNLNWYTDLPHSEDDASWLIDSAVGEEYRFGEGRYKLIRENGKDHLYCVGKKGKATTILRLSFSTSPLKWFSWKEI